MYISCIVDGCRVINARPGYCFWLFARTQMEARGMPLHLLSLIRGASPVTGVLRTQLKQAQNFASAFKQVWHCEPTIFQPQTLGRRVPQACFRSELLLEVRSPCLVDGLAHGGSCAHANCPYDSLLFATCCEVSKTEMMAMPKWWQVLLKRHR